MTAIVTDLPPFVMKRLAPNLRLQSFVPRDAQSHINVKATLRYNALTSRYHLVLSQASVFCHLTSLSISYKYDRKPMLRGIWAQIFFDNGRAVPPSVRLLNMPGLRLVLDRVRLNRGCDK
jgi:hypothetical protein